MKVSLKDIGRCSGTHRAWLYNALDCTGTREIFDALHPRLGELTADTYAFERALQAPFLTMMQEGVLVDVEKRDKRVGELKRELKKTAKAINLLPVVVEKWDALVKETGICDLEAGSRHKWPKDVPDSVDKKCAKCGKARLVKSDFNPASSQQKMRLFYTLLNVPPVRGRNKEITCDDEALDSIGRKFPALLPITNQIVLYQKTHKQIGFLSAKLTSDNRYPSSFNVGTAWTGRASSSKNPFGLGGNLQNVAEQNRDIFIADPGWCIGYADLEQAESNIVAHAAGDEEYIAAHKSGDVHIFVARYVWPELPWTGDMALDKEVAKGLPVWDAIPGHEWRFQAKRAQHGSNYGLTPFGMALQAHIPVAEARRAQGRYFAAFPRIRDHQNGLLKQIQAHLPIVTALGRRFKLFGRPDDPHTHKQALAAEPQSMVADILDLALWRVWDELHGRVRLLAQVHDAVLFLFRQDDHAALAQVKKLMTIPVKINDRVMTLGVDVAVGLNWGKKSPSNPNGLKAWKG